MAELESYYYEVLKNLEIIENNSKVLQRSNDSVSIYASRIEYLNWCIKTSDKVLFSARELIRLNSICDEIVSLLDILLSSSDEETLQELDSIITTALSLFSPPRKISVDIENVDEVLSHARTSTKMLQHDLNVELKKQRELLNENRRESVKVRKQLETLRSEVSVQQGHAESLADSYKALFDNQVEGFRVEFKDILLKMNENYSSRISKFDKKTDETLRFQLREIEEKTQEAVSATKTSSDKARDFVKEIRKLLSAAGADLMSGDMLKQAKVEEVEYRFYTKVALFLYLLSPSILVVLVGFSDIDLNDWMSLLKRLPVAALFLVPAIYVSGLASKHRKMEISFRSLGLKMAAFEPYLNRLNDEDANLLRREMAEKFFNSRISIEKEQELSTKQLGSQLNAISEPLSKIIEMIKKTSGST
ncbi:hypothetical protein PsW64_05286 [Pseudovibrio sp. W64]|uniref:hypothetical protein n=1 Tax=Pseudovibrio sp. W64 TaxID=1735583 RepID=UPI0007AE65EC|nr:hypothetical protein [Pseudovibrio sp. W64]KZK75382.1 hypothetical protein PsW64_05286 [Pseudovibrio sp. W64]